MSDYSCHLSREPTKQIGVYINSLFGGVLHRPDDQSLSRRRIQKLQEDTRTRGGVLVLVHFLFVNLEQMTHKDHNERKGKYYRSTIYHM